VIARGTDDPLAIATGAFEERQRQEHRARCGIDANFEIKQRFRINGLAAGRGKIAPAALGVASRNGGNPPCSYFVLDQSGSN
jgi:hypothetical protein